MKLFSFLTFLLVVVSCQQKQNPVINIETEVGSISIELFSDKAPVTAGNFLKLVDDGVYKRPLFIGWFD